MLWRALKIIYSQQTQHLYRASLELIDGRTANGGAGRLGGGGGGWVNHFVQSERSSSDSAVK